MYVVLSKAHKVCYLTGHYYLRETKGNSTHFKKDKKLISCLASLGHLKKGISKGKREYMGCTSGPSLGNREL